jgi:hypothetical protein
MSTVFSCLGLLILLPIAIVLLFTFPLHAIALGVCILALRAIAS